MIAGLTFRPPASGDEALIARFIRIIARVEGMEHRVTAPADSYTRALIGDAPPIRSVFAELSGEPVGLAIWFYNFSSFSGRFGLFVEDVAVDPNYRRMGIGRAIFRHLARTALADGCDRMQWSVKDDNLQAREFYHRLAAEPLAGYTALRLDAAALAALAHQDEDAT